MISADGTAVGSLTELFINSADWRVESIRLELRNDVADRLGASRTIFHRGTLEVPVSLVQSVGDAIVLSVSVDQLREARRPPPAEPAPQHSP